MDPISIEKFQAMKRYRLRRRRLFFPSLLHYSLATLAGSVTLLGLFLSSPLWLPNLIGLSFLAPLPNLVAVVSAPKCLFLVGNVIVLLLVGESKLLRTSSGPASDIYDEYMMNRKGKNLEQQAESRSEKGRRMAEDERDELDYLDGEEDEWLCEVDKRAEDFIARVNWQRKLEARRLLLSYG
ncbi:hypothetical protein Cni_G03181 [Canna indica]|uniref:DUF4408 domain-containing protein n=1 Tax=Canna indica TaxID=4628 RepID=A0AAQ3Q350_9LILI|nr:hypothetical protein Cni_G03181 [Canna indica]